MKLTTLITSALLVASPALAHEGHDHAPGLTQAPHGGIVKEGKALHLELVRAGSELFLYPLTSDGKSIPVKDVTLIASAQPPKKAKVPVKLEPATDHFVGKLDMKGSYRYELVVEAKKAGQKDSFKFQVEPEN